MGTHKMWEHTGMQNMGMHRNMGTHGNAEMEMHGDMGTHGIAQEHGNAGRWEDHSRRPSPRGWCQLSGSGLHTHVGSESVKFH